MNQLVETHANRLYNKKNVIGVAIGKKWSNGKPTDQDALLILVSQKVPKTSLHKKDLIESSIDGVITDVVGKLGRFSKLPYTRKERPISPGISCGHMLTTAGTIGGLFTDRDNNIVILSNNHVLAAENKGIRGHIAVQPGVYDGGTVGDRIGLLKYYRPLVSSRGQSFDAYRWREIYGYNLEDSAIATIDNPNLITDSIKEIGQINDFKDNPILNESVQKTGRTTGRTVGTIVGLNADLLVRYDLGTIRFKDCILTTNMSQGGDSGSLLLDSNKNAIGLLFAGSNTITVYNPIKYPRASYGLSIYKSRSVVEALSFTVKHNNQIVNHNYSKIVDATRALEEALSNARINNIPTEVSITYKAN